MKMIILSLLLISAPAMANEISCSGLNTEAKLVLGLTERQLDPLSKADYSYGEKLIPCFGYEFGIESEKNNESKKLTYKFQTLKKHKLARKKSKIIFTISENSKDNNPFKFILNDSYEAKLVLEENGVETMLDQMVCTTVNP